MLKLQNVRLGQQCSATMNRLPGGKYEKSACEVRFPLVKDTAT